MKRLTSTLLAFIGVILMAQAARAFDIEPPHLKYYDVSPLTIPAGSRSTITIRPLYEHAAFTGEVKVNVYPIDGLRVDGTYWWGTVENVEFALGEDGALKVTADFAGEQQHDIEVSYVKEKTRWEPERTVTIRFRVYSLEPDLLALKPLKGDFHTHSNLSDGLDSPEYVSARYREEGFDFHAISDHYIYEPSLRAIERCGKYITDFKLFPAEEIHIGYSRVHVLNFGGKYSINALANSDPETFAAGWKAIAETMPPLPGNKPEEYDRRKHAAISEWAFDQIRKAGGVAMLCHYAWQVQGTDVDAWTANTLISRHKFDLLELISGYDRSEWRANNVQIARYYAEMAKGNKLAIAGVSDSHGTDNNVYFNWYYTIVLAKDDSFESIAEALRSGHGVAVEAMDGSVPRVYGDERLVKYVTFLLENYFTRTARLCRAEGQLLKEALTGDEAAAAALKTLQGRVPALREHCFPGK